jgi:hypothetical protein
VGSSGAPTPIKTIVTAHAGARVDRQVRLRRSGYNCGRVRTPLPTRTPTADASTDLVIDLLRLNGLLVTAGDRMVAGLGLTSNPLAGPRPAVCKRRGRTTFPRAWRSRTSTRLAASSRNCGRSSS